MKQRMLIATSLLACSIFPMSAIPAVPTPVTVTQPDGTTLTIQLHGDEFGSYTTTQEGEYVMLCKDGFYRYTQLSADDKLMASNVIARNVVAKDTDAAKFLATVDKASIAQQLQERYEINRERRSVDLLPEEAPMRKVLRKKVAENDEGSEVRGLVLMVEFKDQKFSTSGTVENISALMNEEGNNYMGAIGSARDYFIDQSYGKFRPRFDVVGPITLDKDEAYYGENYEGGGDMRPHEMIIEACKIASEKGLCNMADYDLNADGIVDLVFAVYAGYAEANGAPSNTIWPHAWYIYQGAGEEVILNGVKLDAYACAAELYGTEGTDLYGIGAICHEYTHTLGLPDFYDTGGKGCFGMGNWSVMGTGCHNLQARIPLGFSAHEREFCGWMEITELTEPKTVTVPYLGNTPEAYKIVSRNADRYFTVETRIKSKWDQGMEAEGLLINKVDFDTDLWYYNKVNTNPDRQRMQFVPADNKIDATSYKGDLWPYNGKNEFSYDSMPKMIIHLSSIKDKPMTDIAFDSEKGEVTFNFMGGDAAVEDAIFSDASIYSIGNEIFVKNPTADKAAVYNMQGMLVGEMNLQNGEATFRPATKGIYVVRCGAQCAKVSLR